MIFRTATFADLDALTLYALLRLRVDVFVVEQHCPYPELDGRDTDPGTRHLWFEVDRVPVAYLRLLAEPKPADSPDPSAIARIGRVVTAPSARGQGLAGRLVTAAVAVIGHGPAVLDAQSQLVDFYAKYGFQPSGPEFVEDGIKHVPMRRN
jgi:ElaA protein